MWRHLNLKLRFLYAGLATFAFLLLLTLKQNDPVLLPDSRSSNDSSKLATDPSLGICNFMTMSSDGSESDLGSAMFQYASLYGIASFNRKLPFLQRSSPLYKYFDLTIPEENYSIENFKNLTENDGCCFYQNPKVNCGENITLHGYRRSWRYFHKHRDELKKEFRLLPEFHKLCHSNLSDILEMYNIDTSKCLLIGVHARVGPFWSSPNENVTSHSFDTADFLKRAMHRFKTELRDDYPCVVYLILGNDHEWIVKSIFEQIEVWDFKNDGSIFVAYGSGDPVTDLCILTHMNHTIFTFGSFGWWAAYLTGGIVAYQKEYADVLSEHNE